MDITHLVVNGCSFTYGQGLEDPASDAWPALLGKMLGCDVVNLALPGSSNAGIVRRTYEYFYQNLEKNSKPIFIFGWTIPSRMELYDNKQDSYFTVCPTNDTENEIIKLIYSWHSSDKDDLRRTVEYKLNMLNLMKFNGVPYLFYDFSHDYERLQLKFANVHKIKHLVNYINSDSNNKGYIYEDDLSQGCDPLPCGHDGIEVHKRLANRIFDHIMNQYNSIEVVSGKYVILYDLIHTYIKHPAWIKWKDSKN